MDFTAISSYPFGATPNAHLPLYQKRAVFFNTRRLRECYKEFMELEAAAGDDQNNGEKRLQLLAAIHCLLSANKLAYGFAPGATEGLMVDTGHALVEMRAKIRAMAEEVETITLSSDESDDDEPNMVAAKQEHADS